MMEFFSFMFLVSIAILTLWIIRQKYFAYMVAMVLGIAIFGSGFMWLTNIGKSLDKKADSISNRVYSVQQSIDRFNDSVDKVKDTKDKVSNGIGKITKPINDFDKKLQKHIFNYTGPIFGYRDEDKKGEK